MKRIIENIALTVLSVITVPLGIAFLGLCGDDINWKDRMRVIFGWAFIVRSYYEEIGQW